MKKKKRSIVERSIVWGLIACLLIVALFEWRARRGYQKSLPALQDRIRQEESAGPLVLDDVPILLHGSPSIVQKENKVVYRWSGLFKSYQIVLSFNDESEVLSLHTGLDEPTDSAQPATTVAVKEVKPQPETPKKQPTDSTPTKTTRKTREQRLAEAFHDILPVDEGGKGNLRNLVRYANDLPELKVGTVPGEPLWNTIPVNQTGLGVFAVRFRNPLKVRADMHWVFVQPRSHVATHWSIIARKGSYNLFRDYRTREDFPFSSIDAPMDNSATFQPLYGGRLSPGEEYIVHFRINHADPIDLRCALLVAPVGTLPKDVGSWQNGKTIGIKQLQPDFPNTDEGKRSKMKYAHWVSRTIGINEIRPLLASMRDDIPEIDVTTVDGECRWNSVALNVRNSQFAVVRFKSPLNDSGDLRLAFTGEQALSHWTLVSAEPEPADIFAPYTTVDVEFDGVDVPPKNVTVLQDSHAGAIRPGREYYLCFSSWPNQPNKLKLAVQIQPKGKHDVNSSPAEIAQRLGLSYPEELSEERYQSALKKIDEICRWENGVVRAAGIADSIESRLPMVELSAADQPTKWQSLKPVSPEHSFIVVRCKMPEAEVSDMFVAAVNEGHFSRITTTGKRKGEMLLPKVFIDNDVRFADPDVPQKNSTKLVPAVLLKHAPGETYKLWFFSHFRKFKNLQMGAKVYESQTQPLPINLRSCANLAGTPLYQPPLSQGGRKLGTHLDQATDLSFSDDGSTMMTAGNYGRIHFWNTADNSLEATLQNKVASFASLELSPDGSTLAYSISTPPTIALWDVETQKLKKTIAAKSGEMYAFAFTPSGKQIVGALVNTTQQVATASHFITWDVSTGRELSRKPIEAQVINSIRFLSDKGLFVTAGGHIGTAAIGRYRQDNRLTQWDTSTWKPQPIGRAPFLYYQSLALSNNGNLAAVCSQSGLLELWDVEKKTRQAALAIDAAAAEVAFSPDGKTVAVGGADATVRLWDPEMNRIRHVWNGHVSKVNAIQFSPDGKHIASVGADGAVMLWDVESAAKQKTVQPITNSIGMQLVAIPSGEFDMGLPVSDRRTQVDVNTPVPPERPSHRVEITRSYYIGKHEVTVGQFRQFVTATGHQTTAETNGRGGMFMQKGTGKWITQPEFVWKTPGFQQDDSHPVVQISYHDAQAFCKWLSSKENESYRLPTEAEWEYACRAGGSGVWSSGPYYETHSYAANIQDQAIRESIPRNYFRANWNDHHAFTAPVGSFLPNAWGIHDMHGNVYEWCSDWFDNRYYEYSPKQDPTGPKAGRRRVQRGGGFNTASGDATSAKRDYDDEGSAQAWVGFRVVRESADSSE